MSKPVLRLLLVLVLLAVLQVVLFNHLLLFGYFLPIIYLYPLLKMPVTPEPWVLTLLGAVTGLCIDVMMNTPGLNMAASTLAMFVRPRLLATFLRREDLDKSDDPGGPLAAQLMGGMSYFLYMVSGLLVHISSIFLLEAFSLQLFPHTLPYIGGAMVITLLLCFVFDALFTPRRRA